MTRGFSTPRFQSGALDFVASAGEGLQKRLGHLAPCAVVDANKEDFLLFHVYAGSSIFLGVDYKQQRVIFNIKKRAGKIFSAGCQDAPWGFK